MATAPDPAAPDENDVAQTGVPVRAALVSILGFWLFYFAIVSIRSLALGFASQLEMLVPRAIVAMVGMGLTYLMYRALIAVPRATLRRSIVAAALLAVPASIVYATANWFAFRTIDARVMAAPRKTVIIRSEEPGRVPSVEVLRGDEGEARVRAIRDREAQIAAPPPPPGAPPDAPPPPLPPSTTVITVGGDLDEKKDFTVAAIADNSLNGYFFFVAWAALYLALRYAAETRVAERRTARFRAAAQAAELRALRYQINPHFLFNTLNSLSSLVMIDRREEAERMILNLSTFFRTSLTADPAEDHPLHEEIRLQRLYLEIERVRFPDRLNVEIDVPDEVRDACVPALILQPLVENAIKYGVSRTRRPVTISVMARQDSDGLVLTVADDGAAPAEADPPAEAGTGLGLRNVRDRIAARFDGDGGARWGPLSGGGFVVTLTMPVVRDGC